MSHNLKADLLDFSVVNFINKAWFVERTQLLTVPFLKMTMFKVKEDMTSDCKLIFFI